MHASAPVAANARIAFETLTDYERLRDFVPDVETARVVARDGNRLIVEFIGSLDLFILSLPVRARLAVEHRPYERVIARSEPGLIGTEEATLRAFSGQYVVTALTDPGRDVADARVRIDYDASFRLAHAFPQFIESAFGQEIILRGLRRHFEAMLTEIERRQATAAPPDKR